MLASDCLIQEVDGKAGSERCHGWLSTTCVRWARGASWSLNLCTLLKGDRDQSPSPSGGAIITLHFRVSTKNGSTSR